MKQIITKNEFAQTSERSCLYLLFEKPPEAIPMNAAISNKLCSIKPSLRSIKLETIFVQVLEELSDNPVICDIDVLFNPAYKVDVLNILTLADKQKNFTLVWPGRLVDGKLIYGEEQYSDFKTFEVSNYNIVCVI